MTSAPQDRTVSDEDLRIVALVEGRPRMFGRHLARALGISSTSAWRLLSQLRARGVTRLASAVRTAGDCECVAYLDLAWKDAAAVTELDDFLGKDPTVADAVRVTGSADYRVRAFQRDVAAAHDWFAALLRQGGVRGGRLVFVRSLFDRPCYAAAILGSDRPG